MGEYGENPDPEEERYERLITEGMSRKIGLERLILNESSPRKKGRKRIVKPETYAQFYNKGLKLSQNKDKDAEEKKRLMISYFPRRFAKNGRSIISDFDKYKVGSLFNHIMESAKKYSGIQ